MEICTGESVSDLNLYLLTAASEMPWASFVMLKNLKVPSEKVHGKNCYTKKIERGF